MLNTLYNKNISAPAQITREEYITVGAGINQLGTVLRAFKGGDDFEVWDAAIGGTQLVEGVDYTLHNVNTSLSDEAGYTVYTGYKILNITYQTGSIFITYKVIASAIDAEYQNTERGRVDGALSSLTSQALDLAVLRKNQFKTGLTLSNASDTEHDITIAAGGVWDDTGVMYLQLTAPITKRIDAPWSVGSGNGGLSTGTVAAETDYALWLIRKTSNGSIDVMFDPSFTAPTLPSGYLYKALLPGVYTDASANIVNTQWLKPSQIYDGDAYMKVNERQNAGVNGGTFTSGAWRTRLLNTIRWKEIVGAGLASNQITLPEGTYRISISAPAQQVEGNKLLLYNVTDADDIIVGDVNYCTAAHSVQSKAILIGAFYLPAQKVIEVRHRCDVTFATYGFGTAANYDGKSENYTQVEIWKVKTN